MDQRPSERGASRRGRFGRLLHGGDVATSDLDEIADKLWFDREPGPDAYVRFGVLLFLSVVIASGGVLVDSTATVIGAMIVAPLMTPIMASALAVVTGETRQLWRSLLMVAVGIAVAVGVSFLLGVVSPVVVEATTNSQVAGRIHPRMTDLVIALASGAAGAFALSRRNVSDALPGVAVAISLVPPLCVVGIMLANGDPASASGALLLFSTNFLAILVAGGGLLAIMGYGRVALTREDPRSRRRATLVIAIATVLIAIPLGITTARVAREASLEHQIQSAAERTLDPNIVQLTSVDVHGDVVEVKLESQQDLGAAEARDVAGAIHDAHPELLVRVFVAQAQVIEIPPG